jgi:hypothetical protein
MLSSSPHMPSSPSIITPTTTTSIISIESPLPEIRASLAIVDKTACEVDESKSTLACYDEISDVGSARISAGLCKSKSYLGLDSVLVAT